MPTNKFFNQYAFYGEQNLLDALVVESIKINGIDCTYILRDEKDYQKLYATSDVDIYSDNYLIECYLEDVMGYQGQGELFNKFIGGSDIHDQITLAIAKRSFEIEIGSRTNRIRPTEGDIIFFPFNKRVFQIKFVDKFENFFQFGVTNYWWKCTLELFEYSNEIFNTGIPEIDSLQVNASTNLYDFALKDTDGVPLIHENGDVWVIDNYKITNQVPLADNDEVQLKANLTVQHISETDPFEDANVQVL